jgi:NADH-quinone oxidoreductase subunit D
MRKEMGETVSDIYDSNFEIPVGPQHPALKEPANFTFKVDGEYVVDVEANVSYTHRGIEKAAESRTYIQNLYLVERICGICSNAHQLCYAQGVEQLLEMEAPPRARYIRVIVAELERIHSHMLWVGVAAHEIGFDTLFYYTWRDREVVMDLLERISGNRVNYAMCTIGGVRRDIPPEICNEILKGLKIFDQRLKVYKEICAKEKTILKRAVGVGVLKPSDAISLCAVGPTLRASGVKRDVRADDPYQAYDEIPFNVVTYDGCDVAARVFTRIDEMIESINMIKYAIDHLPPGPIRIKVPMTVSRNETVSRTEAPRGEDIHYIRSNGSDRPERLKVRAPTLGNILAVCKMLIGGYIADIPIVFAAIDPCLSCTARTTFIDVGSGKKWIWSDEELRRYGIRWYQSKGDGGVKKNGFKKFNLQDRSRLGWIEWRGG